MIPPRARRRAKAAGFTLLELLVAVTVLVILVALVQGSFVSVTDSMASARESADLLLLRQMLHRSLSQNLAAVHMDAAALIEENQFLGENQDGGYGPADTLRFCTSQPMPGAFSLPGVLKSVEYKVVPENEVDFEATGYTGGDPERPGMALLITEAPLQRAEGLEGAISGADTLPQSQRAVPVASFNAQYFDGRKEEWVDEWDSLAERQLPWAVWIKVNFPKTSDEAGVEAQAGVNPLESADLEVIAPLMSGAGVDAPFMDFNHVRMTGEMLGGDTGEAGNAPGR